LVRAKNLLQRKIEMDTGWTAILFGRGWDSNPFSREGDTHKIPFFLFWQLFIEKIGE
jgi:hypothetical protein